MERSIHQQCIIMNFSAPPSLDDIDTIARQILLVLPEEILEAFDSLKIQVEDFAADFLQTEFELDDPYDLIALYQSGKEISPGVQSKVASNDDTLFIYRRPLLDLWCETHEDLAQLIREIMIEELAQSLDFSEEEIESMTRRHHQGMF